VLKPAPGTAVVRMRTSDNPFLPRGYVAALRAQYTEQYARQEVDGEFVNLTEGQVYHSFSRDCVRPVVHDKDSPLWLTLDFNVAPLCAVYGQRFARSHRVLGEVHILASGRTADTAEEFSRRMHEAGHRRKVVTVYGDTSGANRDTRSGTTDYAIIQTALMAKGWTVEVRRNYGNPDLVRSVESVNRLLAQRRLDIHESATFLCRDLEQVAWEPGTRLISKKNAQLTHLSDALRYYCSHIMTEEDVHGAKSMPF
jgi:phage terminase large subunit-like protein